MFVLQFFSLSTYIVAILKSNILDEKASFHLKLAFATEKQVYNTKLFFKNNYPNIFMWDLVSKISSQGALR